MDRLQVGQRERRQGSHGQRRAPTRDEDHRSFFGTDVAGELQETKAGGQAVLVGDGMRAPKNLQAFHRLWRRRDDHAAQARIGGSSGASRHGDGGLTQRQDNRRVEARDLFPPCLQRARDRGFGQDGIDRSPRRFQKRPSDRDLEMIQASHHSLKRARASSMSLASIPEYAKRT